MEQQHKNKQKRETKKKKKNLEKRQALTKPAVDHQP